jgi:chromosome segregation ATPase
MNVYPTEFIDSKWFEEKKEEINKVKNEVVEMNQILKRFEEMFENITNYLNDNEKFKEKMQNDVKILEDKLVQIEIKQNSLNKELDSKLNDLLTKVDKLYGGIIDLNSSIEKYKAEHKAEHEKHISILDLLFKRK